MKQKLFTLFVALIATTALWASNVITYTATAKLTSMTLEVGATTFGSAITSHTYNDGTGTITCESEVTTIGDYAFYDCTSLTSITITNSVTTIGEGAFDYCLALTSIDVDVANTHYCSVDGVLFNYAKDILIQYPIGNTRTEYTIPNSVTTIGDLAFFECSGLTSVTIPNSVTTIGEGAFAYCSGLTSVTIPNSVTTIGNGAFRNVNNIVYNGTATGSPWGAKSVNGYIDGYLVYSDASKTTLCGCFTAATGEITIPNSVTTIGNYAFSGCSGLTSVTIPNSVTTIGEDAFYGCTSLPIIDNLRYADTYLVEAVDKTLSSYTIKDGTKWIGSSAFYECTGLTSVTIPNSVTTIGDLAFYECSGLTSVTIPNSVTTIGYGAFAYCFGLTSVTIPNSVTTIGEGAFVGCSALTSITCYAVTPPECGYYVFEDVSQDAKVYVPASALTDYQNAEVWKDMQILPISADIKPIDDENPIVTPTDQDVTITWPITDGTDTYTLTITKGGEVVCVLTFNANGQLVNIAFKAPATNGSSQAPAATLTAQGYQFTVTGLTPGTAYNYSVVATDAGGKTIAEHTGNFSTTGGTGFELVHGSQCTMHKYLHNGQLVIDRNGQHYSAMGERIR